MKKQKHLTVLVSIRLFGWQITALKWIGRQQGRPWQSVLKSMLAASLRRRRLTPEMVEALPPEEEWPSPDVKFDDKV